MKINVNTLFGFINTIFLLLNGLVAVYIRRNSEETEKEREADILTDRLIRLQREERETLNRELIKSNTELAEKNEQHGKTMAEIASLQEKIDILSNAIYNGSREYRQSVVRAVGYKNGELDDKQRNI